MGLVKLTESSSNMGLDKNVKMELDGTNNKGMTVDGTDNGTTQTSNKASTTLIESIKQVNLSQNCPYVSMKIYEKALKQEDKYKNTKKRTFRFESTKLNLKTSLKKIRKRKKRMKSQVEKKK
nr:SWI/SNF-related chromatin remodelling factor [Theileria orientalis]